MIELGKNLAALVERFEGIGPVTEPALARRAVGLLDLTRLDANCDRATIADLCRRAETPLGPVAAVCVPPRFVAVARSCLAKVRSNILVATVVNFPAGEDEVAVLGAETARVLAEGADEIDLVFPYRLFLAGRHEDALAAVTACRAVAGPEPTLKVILEAGCFPNATLLAQAARGVIAAGADFLKTSTGTKEPGVSLNTAAALLGVIHEGGRVGLKVSGGIRQPAAVARYLALADAVMGPDWASPSTFRIGASALLEGLLALTRPLD